MPKNFVNYPKDPRFRTTHQLGRNYMDRVPYTNTGGR
uniref:Uncharacterized protein n=1 Tax=Rhizophora mucronata TaxID=61149 RepID=A0A2P2R5B1_RHIMU